MDPKDPLGLVGTTIDDKYAVERVVGEGGFGVVYRATHRIWNRPVAIKCVKALMDVSPEMRDKLLEDFIQEGAVLSELSGRTASIVQARDVGTLTTKSGQWAPYMVLEWLEGRTLEAVLDERARAAGGAPSPWPLETALRVLEPLALALDAAHRKNVAHRDIKPANVFVVGDVDSDDLVVKLLDFGIAKVVQKAQDHGYTKTGGGVTCFTPAYGAPEQFSRKYGATGPWTDVYALGLVFAELVAGRPALEGDDFIQLAVLTADEKRRPTPRALGAKVPDALEAVLARAVAIRPQDRWQSMGEMWAAVREALGLALPPRSITPRRASGTALAETQVPPSNPRTRVTGDPPGGGSTTAPLEGGAPPPRRRGALLVAVAGGVVGAAAVALAVARGGAAGSATAEARPPVSATLAAIAPSAAPAPPAGCPSDMAEIPGGKTFVGADDGDADERPQHQVKLSPYCMDLHEVSVDEYQKCVEIGDCKRAPQEVSWEGVSPGEVAALSPMCNARSPAERRGHPINCVDWDMADAFCKWKDKRLPTEAEWEFAARGPEQRKFPWGDDPPTEKRLNACGRECAPLARKLGLPPGRTMYEGDDGWPTTAPVGSFPDGRSRYGLYDVAGNVWEWTADFSGPYASEPQTDPQGPAAGKRRVLRGGAFNGIFASWLRPSQRYSDAPATRSHAYGFRCAKGR